MPSSRLHPRGFTLVEILIVVVILGILAAVVLPRFSDASQQARVGTLADDLRFMRVQLQVYAAQHHDLPPGYPDGAPAAAPTDAAFADQLTGPTDERGRAVAADAPGAVGPYLTKVPDNPLNGSSAVKIVVGPVLPPPDNSTGWVYSPTANRFAANLTGTDANGKPYADY